ncbi:O-acetyl-ADP-ribose deacetylase [Enterobacteriaceae bacterium BIT-l23]|uniref:O-acetyl-ADP-ribose deacetylase n=1 Tax=Jejubacter sp. L23 TaxID=3092086 RepID=UPI001585917D|nr:O-acetyl-ADP-ribose deacetylase [Enterobacteriaceae bacterium BIT-l23]
MQHRIEIIQGDITQVNAEAIVNAANSSLMGGGGVDGAIHRAAGPELLSECREVRQRHGECPTGQAVITGAGKLPASAVVHAVGPVWHGGEAGEAELLASAYRNSLQLVSDNSLRSVAFPNISTGVYGYPKALAAEVAWRAVSDFLRTHPLPEQVYFVCYDEENTRLYQRLLAETASE